MRIFSACALVAALVGAALLCCLLAALATSLGLGHDSKAALLRWLRNQLQVVLKVPANSRCLCMRVDVKVCERCGAMTVSI